MGTSNRDYDVRLSKIYPRLNLGDVLDFGSLEQVLNILNAGAYSDLYVHTHATLVNMVTVNDAKVVRADGSILNFIGGDVNLNGFATVTNYNRVAIGLNPQTGILSATPGIENAIKTSVIDPKFVPGEIPLAMVYVQSPTPTIVAADITDYRQWSTGGNANSDDFGNCVALALNATSYTLTFANPLANNNYYVLANLDNIVDINPMFQPITVTARTMTSFTVTWNAPLDSNNYKLSYQVRPLV